MPTGKYIRTTAHKQKIREKLLGTKRPPFSDEWKKNMGIAKMGTKMRWLGEDAKYSAKHMWIKKVLGSPLLCKNCGKTDGTTRNYHWANISHEYKRDLNDWIRLCVSCHKLYDIGKLTLKVKL